MSNSIRLGLYVSLDFCVALAALHPGSACLSSCPASTFFFFSSRKQCVHTSKVLCNLDFSIDLKLRLTIMGIGACAKTCTRGRGGWIVSARFVDPVVGELALVSWQLRAGIVVRKTNAPATETGSWTESIGSSQTALVAKTMALYHEAETIRKNWKK
jgi:hypothetical protein